MKVSITDIKVKCGRRSIDEEKVKEIAESIKEIGLLNPVTLNEDMALIAGLHRLEAVKLNGCTHIEATIINVDSLHAELAEIDENLIRNELHFTDRGNQYKRRKEIYEELHPETKQGGDRGNQYTGGKVRIPQSATSFVSDTATKTGKSTRVIHEELQIADKIIPEVQKVIKENDISKKEALKIARLEPEKQKKAVIDLTKKAHVSNNSGNNEWYTPKHYIDIAYEVMGGIDCDPASSDIANKTVQAAEYYTAQDNGLNQSWYGRIWMNPPYAQPLIQQFCDKLIGEIETGNVIQACILVNNATETTWFQTLLKNASAIWFIKARVKFIDMYGNPSGAPLQGQCMLYFGGNVNKFIQICEGIVFRRG
jgi:ParB family chromosome partitioning protein